jgi:hypothetical protein
VRKEGLKHFFELITQFLAQTSDFNIRAVAQILVFSFAQSAKSKFSAQEAAPFARSAKLVTHSFYPIVTRINSSFTLPLPAATNSHAI